MNKQILYPIITSIIVAVYGIMFHAAKVTPNDWGAVALWLPVYIAPIWIIYGLVNLSGKKNK